MKFFLAPMADISDRIFREVCYLAGADYCYSEMISIKALLFNSKKTLEMTEVSETEQHTFIQIFDSTPENFAPAMKIIEENRSFYGFDINMGCPVKKVIKAGSGSALLKEPEKVRAIIKNARSGTKKPLSVKIRKGFEAPNAEIIAKIAEEEGADMLVLHPRLKTEMFSGISDFELSRKIAETVSIPVIHSGDITNLAMLKKLLDTRLYGVMIGRGTLGKPWIFQELKDECELDDEFKKEIMMIHFNKILAYHTTIHLMIELKKHAAWYSKGYEAGSIFRQKLYEEFRELPELIDGINFFFGIKIG